MRERVSESNARAQPQRSFARFYFVLLPFDVSIPRIDASNSLQQTDTTTITEEEEVEEKNQRLMDV